MEVNKKQLADIFGASIRTIQNWQEQGMPVLRGGGKGNEVLYDSAAVIRWYAERDAEIENEKLRREVEELRQASETDLQPGTIEYERHRLTRAQADAQELKNARDSAEVVETAFCTFVLSRIAGEIASILDGIPLSVQRRFPELENRHVDFLKRDIIKAMNKAAALDELINSQTRTLTLDREITLPSSGTTLISLVDGQGSPVSVEVQSVTDGVKVKVSRVPDGVAEYSVWGLKLPTLRQRLFRCVSIRENDDGTYAITAVQHVSTTTGNWTTAQFIEWLDSQGAFNHPYWMCKGSWSYGNNKIITDTDCGNIHLAGAVIEVMGIKSAMTIRITTPTTSTGGGTTNAQFTYINHGTDYSPGWRRDYNSRNKPTASEIGALPSGGTAVSSVNLASKGRVPRFQI